LEIILIFAYRFFSFIEQSVGCFVCAYFLYMFLVYYNLLEQFKDYWYPFSSYWYLFSHWFLGCSY